MKNFKILGVTLSLFFILTDLFGYCVYAQSFEEDEDNDLAIIEEDDDYNTDDVDIENLLNSIRVNARCAIAMDSKTKQVLFEQNADEISFVHGFISSFTFCSILAECQNISALFSIHFKGT